MAKNYIRVNVTTNITSAEDAKVYFPTDDGMAIGKPVVNIWFKDKQYLEISADDFERIYRRLKDELKVWEELNV